MAPQPAFSCILDGVQFIYVKNAITRLQASATSLRESKDSVKSDDYMATGPITLKFHYTRRMAGIIKEEEEKARKAAEEAERLRIEA